MHVVQRRLFTKAAITLKLEALFVQNLTLKKYIISFKFAQFIELILTHNSTGWGVIIDFFPYRLWAE